MIPLYDQNPPRRQPFVTKWLIYLNVAAFLLQWLSASPEIALIYGFVPARASQSFLAELPQVFTSMFVHAGIGHLAWNMLFLHIFGDNVEDLLGRGRFLLFYLLAGLGGALGQYVQAPMSPVPMVGASGAIAGVLGAYLILHPKAPVILLNPILPLWLLMGPFLALPAWIVVGYWFFGNLIGGLASLGGHAAGVAFFAHIGGFLTGLLLTRPLLKHPGELPDRQNWHGFRPPPRQAPQRKVFWKPDDRPFWR
jgi:membrane associated rhomboid family serine protease